MNDDQRANEFLGKGWGFPVSIDERGQIGMASEEEDVRQAIRVILGTTIGERVMRPGWGVGLRAMVFEPMTATTAAQVRQLIEDALIQWEPRIDDITVRVTLMPDRGILQAEIEYRIRITNTFYNLVYPFYLFEHTPT